MGIMAYSPYGASGIIIRVEADIRRGIPGIDITGLAEGAVREARERVRAAFRNSGFDFPLDRILINLAPAGLRKEGTSLDLPIALSVMAAAGLAPLDGDIMVLGELELSGRIRPVNGVLAAIAEGLDRGITEFIVPVQNVNEAAILGTERGARPAARFAAVSSLAEAAHVLFIREEAGCMPENNFIGDQQSKISGVTGDFSDVRGQKIYKRALEIAAAGGHNALVFGPPGAGKTMLARRLPSIMAPLDPEEAVEVTKLHSLAGPFMDGLITHPPFRAPHHSASAEGILGGGKNSRPGEISLAHFGILFLDEAPEFRANVLQALREPLEDGVISIARAEGTVRLPAQFQLLLAANACPCGCLGIRNVNGMAENADFVHAGTCFCSTEEINRYWRRFGGALLDRIELRTAVLPPDANEMSVSGNSGNGPEESSAEIARRVFMAVQIQRERFKNTGIRRNALLPAGMIEDHCTLSSKAKTAFNTVISKLGLSARAYHGILRVARTIADLEGRDTIDTVHILEAVQHRRQGDDPFEILYSFD